MQTRHLARAGGRLAGRALLGRPLLVEGPAPRVARACSGISGQGPYAGISKQGSYEGHGKTSVAILNEDAQGINMIDSYAQDGFRLNDDTKILGPCIVFPTAVLGWRIRSAADITEESLTLFLLLDPRLDLLIIGHGGPAGTRDAVRPEVVLRMRARGLGLEVLTTEQAISTYNFLAEEGRVVAAALIPPDSVLIKDEDIVHTKERYRTLLSNPDSSMIGGRRNDYKEDKGDFSP
jgi:NADH dehydrogenase [ubiquinone] 1 alpha subcomplex assembly factor 3